MKKILLLAFIALMPLVAHATESAQESTFDRVVRTGTLRCGYGISKPNLVKDANNGQLSGISYDVTNALAERLGLKVEWAEETGFGTAEQGLMSKRYDLVCSNVCIEPRRTRAAWFSVPYTHEPVYAVVRGNDTRFDASLAPANAPGAKIAVVDGSILATLAADNFPQAQRMDIGEFGIAGDFMLIVAGGKADMSFNLAYAVDQFLKSNPGTIKMVGDPVGMCHGAFLLPLGDEKFRTLIDTAMTDLIDRGQIDSITTKHVGDDPRYRISPLSPWPNAH